MISNHELARRYKEKSRLIGKDTLELELVSNDGVVLLGVKDKDNDGRLEIPRFITSIQAGALCGCKYNDIYIDNNERLMNIRGLCTHIESSGIKLSFRDSSRVGDMSNLFAYASKLRSIDISSLKGESLVCMGNMFSDCNMLNEIKFSDELDTSKVDDMGYLFSNCHMLDKIDISKWDTKNVKNMACMFTGCISLVSLDIGNLDTSKVEDMSYMFELCTKLRSIDISKWDTRKVKTMRGMFKECMVLDYIDTSNIDIRSLIDVKYMFYYCDRLNVNAIDFNKFKGISGFKDMYGGSYSIIKSS